MDQDADRSCRKSAGSCVAASICLDDYLKVWLGDNGMFQLALLHLTVPASTLMSCLVTHTNSRSQGGHQQSSRLSKQNASKLLLAIQKLETYCVYQ